jgi:hypothetical protein
MFPTNGIEHEPHMFIKDEAYDFSVDLDII